MKAGMDSRVEQGQKNVIITILQEIGIFGGFDPCFALVGVAVMLRSAKKSLRKTPFCMRSHGILAAT
jgi:hypothetical protein